MDTSMLGSYQNSSKNPESLVLKTVATLQNKYPQAQEKKLNLEIVAFDETLYMELQMNQLFMRKTILTLIFPYN